MRAERGVRIARRVRILLGRAVVRRVREEIGDQLPIRDVGEVHHGPDSKSSLALREPRRYTGAPHPGGVPWPSSPAGSRFPFASLSSLRCRSSPPGGAAGRGGSREGHRDPVGHLRHPAHLRAGSSEPVLRLRVSRRWKATPSCWCASTRRRAGRARSSTATRTSRAIEWVRTTGIPQKAKQWEAQQSPEFGALIRAFADGLNAWAAKNPQQLSAAARRVLPLTAEDVYAHGLRIIHYDWLTSEQNVYRKARQEVIETHGSNGWAIGPSKSATGNAMLMSNSHLPWSDSDTYFEVQLSAPGVTSYGAVWVGFPVLRQCFTEFVAWTQTTNGPTGADVYRLTLYRRRLHARRQGARVRDRSAGHQGAPARRHVEGRAAHDSPLGARTGFCGSPRRDRGAARHARPIGRRCSSSSGAWGWRRTSTSGAPRCGCSSCRSSTPCTRIATATSCTSTTPRRRCGSTATHAYWSGVIPGDRSELIAAPRSCRSISCRRRSIRRAAGCRTATIRRGRRPTRRSSTRRSTRPTSRRRRATPSARSAASGCCRSRARSRSSS